MYRSLVIRHGQKPNRKQFLQCASALSGVSLRVGDFEAVVREHAAEGDFVYLDPPYATRARRIFQEYDPATFTIDDLARLANLLGELAAKGVTFVLSYAYCPEILELLGGWKHKKLFVQRNIAGFAGHRRVAAEILVTNACRP